VCHAPPAMSGVDSCSLTRLAQRVRRQKPSSKLLRHNSRCLWLHCATTTAKSKSHALHRRCQLGSLGKKSRTQKMTVRFATSPLSQASPTQNHPRAMLYPLVAPHSSLKMEVFGTYRPHPRRKVGRMAERARALLIPKQRFQGIALQTRSKVRQTARMQPKSLRCRVSRTVSRPQVLTFKH
jgi:hypothetical protein